jgi:hypothetical protein
MTVAGVDHRHRSAGKLPIGQHFDQLAFCECSAANDRRYFRDTQAVYHGLLNASVVVDRGARHGRNANRLITPSQAPLYAAAHA